MKNLPLSLVALLLASCAVGPDHKKPDVADITPAKWKWKSAAPRDSAPKGEWWTVFKDKELNRLEALAVASNNDLRAAVARVEQARATASGSGVALLPDASLGALAKRERTSANQPTPVPIAIPAAQLNTYNLGLNLSYELDLWGRIRRSVEGAQADAEGSAADYQNVLLTLTGEVAADYFQLCAIDAEMAVLRRTLETREKSLGIIDQRFKAGMLPEVDAARARSELATTRAEVADVQRQRAELVAVLALLCGKPASSFSIAERPATANPPSIPAGIPAEVLERRPDIASAERKVASRSAAIGAEKAGYYPSVHLTGGGGYLSKETGNLFSTPSSIWSIGPGVTLPFTGFLVTKAKVERAKAAHEEAVAGYRQAVLTAIKDVETSLTQIRYRGEQVAAQADAVGAANKAADLVRSRYEGGAVSYLELLDAERTSLLLERQAAQVKAQRLIATVRLIKALGGKW